MVIALNLRGGCIDEPEPARAGIANFHNSRLVPVSGVPQTMQGTSVDGAPPASTSNTFTGKLRLVSVVDVRTESKRGPCDGPTQFAGSPPSSTKQETSVVTSGAR